MKCLSVLVYCTSSVSQSKQLEFACLGLVDAGYYPSGSIVGMDGAQKEDRGIGPHASYNTSVLRSSL